jgi:hypothetical protein
MRLRGARYVYRGRLARRAHKGHSFGGLRLKRSARVLWLRAYVRGVGRSNIVRVRIGR